MLADVKTFESHEYQVVGGQIAYADQDALSFNKQFGYKTTFAYFAEHSRGKVAQKTLEEHLYLLVKCGNFSYAEIPNHFHSILGVTGTLSTLSPAERELLKSDFGVKRYTYIPSVYGANQLQFHGNTTDDMKILDSEAAYFMEIVNEIKTRLIGSIEGSSRLNTRIRIHYLS